MFYGRMREYPIEKPIAKEDKFGFGFKEYEDGGTARIYITNLDTSRYTANDLSLIQRQFIGYTDDKELDSDWRIDGKYKVNYVVPYRAGFKLLYLDLLESSNE